FKWPPSRSRWARPKPISTPRLLCIQALPKNSSPCVRSGLPCRRLRPSLNKRRKVLMKRLEGRVALVTGSGSGIGRATVQLFAREGATVYVTDVNGEAAGTVAAEITATGAVAHAITADVSRGQDVTAMFRTVEKAHGRLDVLVNNAGLNVRSDF